MNLRQLQYFYDTAQTKSLTKTAEKYQVPASSVSASIKRLEEELGCKLFDRSSNRIMLNEKGKLFAGELHAIFDHLDHAVSLVSEALPPHPQIKILIRARPKWITELITEYKETHPVVNFIISNDYTLEELEPFDFIIDEDSSKYKSRDRFLLSSEIICVKASSDHPLVHRQLTFSQLEKEAFILPSLGNGMRNLYERICRERGLKPNVTIECNDRQCLQYYVASNMGLTLGAYRALDDQTQNHIAPLQVLDFNEVQAVYVFHRDVAQFSLYLREFYDFLYGRRYL